MSEKYPKLSNSDIQALNLGVGKGGTWQVQVGSWDDFRKVLEVSPKTTNYLWRGQRCCGPKWVLKSSFDRVYHGKRREQKLRSALADFRRRVAQVASDVPLAIEENTLWAIGQHYGLPSPLLDWTQDPYIAAYFAFWQRRRRGERGPRVIYGLNRALQRLKDNNSDQRFVDFVEPILTEQSHDCVQNRRLEAQRGTFTKALNGRDIRENVARLVQKRPDYDEKILLVEVHFQNTQRQEWLKRLECERSITHARLFPDYSGAAEACRNEMRL